MLSISVTWILVPIISLVLVSSPDPNTSLALEASATRFTISASDPAFSINSFPPRATTCLS